MEKMKELFNKLKQATDAFYSRLFVVLTAQANGWQFDKQPEFLESGMPH